MRPLRIRSMSSVLFAAVALATNGLATVVQAEDASQFSGAPNQEYLDQRAQLEKLVSDRDVDLYELHVEPLELNMILLKDRLGNITGYHYLTFRLRNEIIDATQPKIAKSSRYNEVLKTLADQYEFAKRSNDNGGKLSVETSSPEATDGTILERQDLKARTRTVNIHVVITDEHGSRIHLLDDPAGSGPQEAYNFPDLGERSRDDVYKQVRDAIEERVVRRLHTVQEVSKIKLPPYDPTKVDEEGVAAGELYCVVIFDRLSMYGQEFTVTIQGLSNKLRYRQQNGLKLIDVPDAKVGEPSNYLLSRVLRREYVMHYHRPGDEFYRNFEEFTLEKSGWEWDETSQPLKSRKLSAYIRYFLDNIADENNAPRPDVEKEFWAYYNNARTVDFPNAGDKLPDLEKTLQDRTSGGK